MPTKPANPAPRPPQKIPKATPAKRYLRRELDAQLVNRTPGSEVDNIQVNPAVGTTSLPNYLFNKNYRLFGLYLPLGLGSHFDLNGVRQYFDKDYFEPFEDLFWSYYKIPVRHDLPWEKLPSSYITVRLRIQDEEL
jgi:hypothetical protein